MVSNSLVVKILGSLVICFMFCGCPMWSVEKISIPDAYSEGSGTLKLARNYDVVMNHSAQTPAERKPMRIHPQLFEYGEYIGQNRIESIGIDVFDITQNKYIFKPIIYPSDESPTWPIKISGISAEYDNINKLNIAFIYNTERGVEEKPGWSWRKYNVAWIQWDVNNSPNPLTDLNDVAPHIKMSYPEYMIMPGVINNGAGGMIDFKYDKFGNGATIVVDPVMLLVDSGGGEEKPLLAAHRLYLYNGVLCNENISYVEIQNDSIFGQRGELGNVLDVDMELFTNSSGAVQKIGIAYVIGYQNNRVVYREFNPVSLVENVEMQKVFIPDSGQSANRVSLAIANGVPLVSYSTHGSQGYNHVYFTKNNGSGWSNVEDLCNVNISTDAAKIQNLKDRGASLGDMIVNPGDGIISLSISTSAESKPGGSKATTYLFRRPINGSWSLGSKGIVANSGQAPEGVAILDIRPLICADLPATGSSGVRTREWIYCTYKDNEGTEYDYGIANSQ